MFAVIVNAVTSSLGALLGFLLKRGIPERFTKAIFWCHFSVRRHHGHTGAVQSQNLLLVLASMIIGTLVGTAIGIEDGMNRFGEFLKKRMGHGDDSRFVRGFVTLSIMQVIGAMAILGPIQAALGSHDLLYFKSALDFTSSFIFGTLYGLGVVPVGIVLFIYQGIFLSVGDLHHAPHDTRCHPGIECRRQCHDPGYCPQHVPVDEAESSRLPASPVHTYYLLSFNRLMRVVTTMCHLSYIPIIYRIHGGTP